MARLESVVKFTAELRPCYVNGTKALFHKWAEKDDVILKLNMNCSHSNCNVDRLINIYKNKQVLPAGCKLEKVKTTVGIVEYDDGSVAEVEPCKIRFVDNKMLDYAF